MKKEKKITNLRLVQIAVGWDITYKLQSKAGWFSKWEDVVEGTSNKPIIYNNEIDAQEDFDKISRQIFIDKPRYHVLRSRSK